jgi:hypothetical protein
MLGKELVELCENNAAAGDLFLLTSLRIPTYVCIELGDTASAATVLAGWER